MRVVSVCRKPVLGTITNNVMVFGTGGLHIARSRIGLTNNVEFGNGPASWVGRWPPNVVLEHRAGCARNGTRRVQAASLNSPAPIRKTGVHSERGGHQQIGRVQPVFQGYGDADGLEAVEDWVCAPGCPVALLDSRTTSSVTGQRSVASQEATVEGTQWLSTNHQSTGDTGGVSRFYRQVQEDPMATMPPDLVEYLSNMIGTPEIGGEYWNLSDVGFDEKLKGLKDESVAGVVLEGQPTPEQSAEILRVLMPGAHLLLVAPDHEPTGHTGACTIEDAGFEIRDSILWVQDATKLHYVPKPARREREAGCYDLKGKSGHEAVERVEGSAGMNNPRAGAGRTADVVKNYHPTVKPIALMERLLANVPKDAVVLDPFLGSGTTGIACVRTGHSFVGIEMGADYLEIADTRIRHWDSLRPGLGAKIQSDHVPPEEETEAVDFMVFFGGGSGK